MKSKKILSLLLVVVLVFALCGSAFAAEAEAPTTAPAEMAGQVVILHTNDVHGAISGYAKIAALKAAYEAKGAYVLLVDAGDYSQGTTSVSISKGANAVDLMNLAGYDAATLGNHEFDYGYEQLKTNLSKAAFKVIAANVMYNGAVAFDDNEIFTTPGGLKIGVFGLDTPETATKANPTMIKGVTFADVIATAKAQVAALEAEKCDLIVCLGHLGIDEESAGNRSTDLLAKVTGIDLFIDGHSHSVIDGMSAEGKVGDTMLVSTGTAFAKIGVVVLKDGALASSLVDVTDDMAADETVKAAADAIDAAIKAEYGVKFATTEVELNGAKAPGNRTEETNLGDLITDAIKWKCEQEGLKVDAALTNGGGIRATVKKGDITKNDINTVLPFGNTLAVVQVTGAELLEALEASTYCTPTAVGGFPQVSGISFTIDTTKDFDKGEQYSGSTYYAPKTIQRVSIATVGGKTFDAKATYTIATNNFTAAGGDTYYVFSAATSNVDTGYVLDEVVMEYITSALKGNVTAADYGETDGEITIRKSVKDIFTDIPADAWYMDEAQFCYEKGFMIGDAGAFTPEAQLTNAQFFTVLYRFAHGEGLIEQYADDGENWMDGAKAAAAMLKFTFTDEQWNAPMTRAEMAAAASAAIKYYCENAKVAAKETEVTPFTDCVGNKYVEDIEFLHAIGVLQGDDSATYRPDGTIKRCEVAAVIYRFATAVVFEPAVAAAA